MIHKRICNPTQFIVLSLLSFCTLSVFIPDCRVMIHGTQVLILLSFGAAAHRGAHRPFLPKHAHTAHTRRTQGAHRAHAN